MAHPNLLQPKYYQSADRSSVEQQLWTELRSPADQQLLHAIFSSQEWRSQSLPIPEDFIRQLRHPLEIQSGVAYACAFCSVTEKEANHMTEHIDTHFGLKRYPCFECGHTALRKNDLDTHLKTHCPEDIYCPQGCGQLFNSKKNIKRHVEKTCPKAAR